MYTHTQTETQMHTHILVYIYVHNNMFYLSRPIAPCSLSWEADIDRLYQQAVLSCFWLDLAPDGRKVRPHDGSLSLTLLSLFLSFIFCPTSFQREWVAFLGAWCPPPAFRSCFVEVAQHSNKLLMNLWGRQWSPHPIPPPSWDHPTGHEIIMKVF